jgi:transposase
MRIVGLSKEFYYLSKNRPIEISPIAQQRLQWLKTWQRIRAEGFSAGKAAEILRLPRSTLYRWQKRLEEQGARGLEDGDRRPKHVRRPQWSPELVEAVLSLREAYPGMGKEKLWKLLSRVGVHTSVSTVGRILKRMKERGMLREPPRNGITKRKRRLVRPYATRKPKGYRAKKPGDLVQVDTLDVRPLPDVRLKHFTARDMDSRWDVIEAYRSATAGNAKRFLNTLIERAPYPVKAIQVDGGSEFMAEFEQACADKGILLFVLPPRSPKLNGHVERAQRRVRPHHSLDLMSPAEYLYKHHQGLVPLSKLSHMC